MSKTGTLEKSKTRRRQQILGAAREIVREADNGLVMRTLAERAGVSLTTPYNLFGSQRAVLLQLFEDDAAEFGVDFDSRSSSDRLTNIFELNEMTYAFYERDAAYFQNLLAGLYRSQDAELRRAVLKPRTAFLKRLLRDCIADGWLDPSTNAVLHAQLMVAVHAHVAQDWAAGAISSERAVLEIGYGYSTILLSAGTPRSTERLIKLQHDFQVKIEESSRA